MCYTESINKIFVKLGDFMKIFGWEHITYLLVWLAVSIPALICVKKYAKMT